VIIKGESLPAPCSELPLASVAKWAATIPAATSVSAGAELRYALLHKDSDQASLMLEATRRQDKLWPAVEAALAAQDRWASHDQPDIAQLWTALAAACIDIERVHADMKTETVAAALAQDAAALTAPKIQRTPTFHANGEPLVDFGTQQLKALIGDEVKAAYASCTKCRYT
jgi:predicted DsbA family dithiol-disulfide isomerase